MPARLIHYGIKELDGSEFTQKISLHVFSRADASATPIFAGIASESRLGDDFMNWAIFERPDQDRVWNASASDFAFDDPNLVAALGLFDLELAHRH